MGDKGIMTGVRAIVAAGTILGLGACTTVSDGFLAEEPTLQAPSKISRALESLPPPQEPIYAAVYQFDDLTGQRKPNDNFADFSSAVTQGGSEILIDSLFRAGYGKWFKVVERRRLDNILRERQIIRSTREQFMGKNADNVPPMKFAGMIIEGGIVAYESNSVTGGAGAALLGIGSSTQYRRDVVTVAMRAVTVKDGSVVASVTTSKTIYSVSGRADVFRYVAVDEILELEAGASRNEPPQFAIRQAIELGVYALIMEGVDKGLWSFADADANTAHLDNYHRAKDSYNGKILRRGLPKVDAHGNLVKE